MSQKIEIDWENVPDNPICCDPKAHIFKAYAKARERITPCAINVERLGTNGNVYCGQNSIPTSCPFRSKMTDPKGIMTRADHY